MQDFTVNCAHQELEWDKKVLIGQGAYSKVYKVQNKRTKQYLALKEFQLYNIQNEEEKYHILNQIFILKELKSPNTVQLRSFSINQTSAFVVMELCETDLRQFILKNKSKISQDQCIRLLTQIIKGLSVLNERSYVHRDIKPQNILIKNGQCKLSDFGFACKVKLNQQQQLTQACGTPAYMCPQMLKNQVYTYKCDIWSLGIVFYQMIYGFTPWPGKTIQKSKDSIFQQRLTFPLSKKVGQKVKDFIKKCLTIQQKQRINWKQLISHPLIKDNYPKLYQKLILTNPILNYMLKTIQKQINIQQISIKNIFNKYYCLYKLNFNKLCQLLRQLNPSITTHQCDFLFKLLQKQNNNYIIINQLELLFKQINSKKCSKTIKKHIKTIVNIIQAQKYNFNQLFKQIDLNNNQYLDKYQFLRFLRKILPQLNLKQKLQIFNQFDQDKSGLITKQQFIKQLSYTLVKKYTDEDKIKQRALRNIINLKQFIKIKQIKPQQFLLFFDKNQNQKIQLQQLQSVILDMGYVISQMQVIQIFQLTDHNHSSSIQLSQLKLILNQ